MATSNPQQQEIPEPTPILLVKGDALYKQLASKGLEKFVSCNGGTKSYYHDFIVNDQFKTKGQLEQEETAERLASGQQPHSRKRSRRAYSEDQGEREAPDSLQKPVKVARKAGAITRKSNRPGMDLLNSTFAPLLSPEPLSSRTLMRVDEKSPLTQLQTLPGTVDSSAYGQGNRPIPPRTGLQSQSSSHGPVGSTIAKTSGQQLYHQAAEAHQNQVPLGRRQMLGQLHNSTRGVTEQRSGESKNKISNHRDGKENIPPAYLPVNPLFESSDVVQPRTAITAPTKRWQALAGYHQIGISVPVQSVAFYQGSASRPATSIPPQASLPLPQPVQPAQTVGAVPASVPLPVHLSHNGVKFKKGTILSHPHEDEPLPAQLTCKEICQQYPNHLVHDHVLEDFVQQEWTAMRILSWMPEMEHLPKDQAVTNALKRDNAMQKRIDKVKERRVARNISAVPQKANCRASGTLPGPDKGPNNRNGNAIGYAFALKEQEKRATARAQKAAEVANTGQSAAGVGQPAGSGSSQNLPAATNTNQGVLSPYIFVPTTNAASLPPLQSSNVLQEELMSDVQPHPDPATIQTTTDNEEHIQMDQVGGAKQANLTAPIESPVISALAEVEPLGEQLDDADLSETAPLTYLSSVVWYVDNHGLLKPFELSREEWLAHRGAFIELIFSIETAIAELDILHDMKIPSLESLDAVFAFRTKLFHELCPHAPKPEESRTHLVRDFEEYAHMACVAMMDDPRSHSDEPAEFESWVRDRYFRAMANQLETLNSAHQLLSGTLKTVKAKEAEDTAAAAATTTDASSSVTPDQSTNHHQDAAHALTWQWEDGVRLAHHTKQAEDFLRNKIFQGAYQLVDESSENKIMAKEAKVAQAKGLVSQYFNRCTAWFERKYGQVRFEHPERRLQYQLDQCLYVASQDFKSKDRRWQSEDGAMRDTMLVEIRKKAMEKQVRALETYLTELRASVLKGRKSAQASAVEPAVSTGLLVSEADHFAEAASSNKRSRDEGDGNEDVPMPTTKRRRVDPSSEAQSASAAESGPGNSMLPPTRTSMQVTDTRQQTADASSLTAVPEAQQHRRTRTEFQHYSARDDPELLDPLTLNHAVLACQVFNFGDADTYTHNGRTYHPMEDVYAPHDRDEAFE